MSNWTPRSQRLGKRDLDGPFEGVPPHLKPQIFKWLNDTLHSSLDADKWANVLAMRLHIPVNHRQGAAYSVLQAAADDDDLLLDIVEGALRVQPRYGYDTDARESLQSILDLCGSVYTVSDALILVDRVGPEVEETRAKAVSVADEATDELSEAWSRAFGRNPDASDAWDHAIKAVESVLQPIVEPGNTKATLGSIIARLEQNDGAHWRCVFPGANKSHSVENFVKILRLIWPNPDRHGPVTRKPTNEEARAVVVQAAAILQWHREGTVVAPR